MSLETLIKEVEAVFPPKTFQWCLSRNQTGNYFANIFPVSLSEVGKGPDNHVYGSTPSKTLRAAFDKAKKNGVGRHLFGKVVT